MPVEIRELVIRAVVNDSSSSSETRQQIDETERQLVIQECVREIMKLLEKNKGR